MRLEPQAALPPYLLNSSGQYFNLLEHNPSHRFALKTFLNDFGKEITRDNFENELKANRSIPRNNRILSLLAAFEHRGGLYLLFPWAESGDLRMIWEGHGPRHDEATGRQVAHAEWYSPEWLLTECLGIASAVADIHGLMRSTPASTCLLHADIKPENILGFPADGGSVSLKLADFGHSKVLETPSSYVGVRGMAFTKSYRAPEYDTQRTVTTRFDVWSLGCLFLDFVTWALMGSDKVEEFGDRRLQEEKDVAEDDENVFEDTFFKQATERRSLLSWLKISFPKGYNLGLRGCKRPVVTKVRDSVTTQIESLRNHQECDDGIRQLLDLIETRMLVPNCDFIMKTGAARQPKQLE
ncbi:uncharacterized protein PG986_009923 [Apiospora aurea]|uniref:Protein kinase domain-containing protein n=1 Tax=Apiospora aurea TaxID=335848 RepID=A0ABR1Q924_9PEZI